MLTSWSLILIALAYMGLLFAVAWYGDKQRIARNHRNVQALIYSLSLAVYCTSWTFYGAVGSAATTGWGYLPIYLGPMLVMLLGFDLIRRIAETSRDQRITSIADLISSRFGKSNALAVFVTLLAVIASTPYIALQLQSVTLAFSVFRPAGTGATDPTVIDGRPETSRTQPASRRIGEGFCVDPDPHADQRRPDNAGDVSDNRTEFGQYFLKLLGFTDLELFFENLNNLGIRFGPGLFLNPKIIGIFLERLRGVTARMTRKDA